MRIRATAVGIAAALLALLALGSAAPASAADPSPTTSTSSLGDGGSGSGSLTFGLQPVTTTGQPPRGSFNVAARPGDVIDDAVSIYNYSNAPLSFRLYAADARNQAVGGGFSLLEFGETSTDVGTWVTAPKVGKKLITVPARTQVDMPIRITVPTSVTPGDHVGGVLLSVPSPDAASDSVIVEPRIGVPVRVRVAGVLDARLEITGLAAAYDLEARPWRAGTATVTYRVENTGNVTLAARPSVAIDGPFGWGGQSRTLPDTEPILPGQSVRIETSFSDVWPLVRYSVTASVDPLARTGDAAVPPVSAQTQLWAIPWPQIVCLILLILASGLGYWLRRRSVGSPPSGGTHSRAPGSDRSFVGSNS